MKKNPDQPTLFTLQQDAYGDDLVVSSAKTEPVAEHDRQRVFAFICGRGNVGATDEEMQQYIPMAADAQTARLVELVAAGLVRDSGNARPTRSGRSTPAWVAKAEVDG